MQFEKTGKGAPVLLVQGVGMHGSGWLPQIAELSKRYCCVSFDNRGIGRNLSEMSPTIPLTVEQMAEDAFHVMDLAGFRSAHIVGHSLGGLIALFMGQIAPERIKSLALLCTFGNGAAAAPLSRRMIWHGMRSRIGSRASRREGFLGLVLPPPAPGGPEAAKLASELAALFGHDLADTPAIVPHQLDAMRSANAMTRMADLAGIRTLVMSAEHDPIAPPALGRAIAAAIPGAKFIEVPDASHGLPITHAELVNEALEHHFQAI